jgi:pimeloyl-ACP methyl ester carboxylesterase
MANMRVACLWVVVWVFAVVLIAGCDPRPSAMPLTSPEEVANNSDPQWVIRQETPAKVAIVFVHGLFGDTLSTWTNANGKRFFDFVGDDVVAKGHVDIFAFGFPSHMFAAGSFDIQAAAKALHANLVHHGILSYSKVVFVGHSMGGLVIMRELLMSRSALPSVPVIALVASPQEGADIARIADYVARNPALSQMKPADRNDLLKILNDDWRAWPARPKVACAYENKPTKGAIMVVKWSSSTRFCDESVEVSADHIEISKPASGSDLAVLAVTNALKSYVFNPALEPRLETPDFVVEGDRAIFVLSQVDVKLPAPVVNSGGSALHYSLGEPSDRNALLLWPDRPQELPPKSRDSLFVYLVGDAAQREYQFALRTDYGFRQTVVVRGPALEVLRSQHVELVRGASEALLAQFETGGVAVRWKAAAADDAEIPEAIARSVREHIARERPQWPEGVQWVVAADVLNSLNWSSLAARALRHAENAAPTIVQQSSVQHVAAVAAAQSGETKIFSTVDITPEPPPSVEPTRSSWLAADPGAARLAQQFVQVPSLKFYGLSLEGDLRAARADVEGARAAYQDAAVIRPTPSITKRLQVTGGWRTTPIAPIGPATSGPPIANVPPAAVVVQPVTPARGTPVDLKARPPANPRTIVVQPAERER